MASPRLGLAVVTPASRGLGFALTQHLLTHTDLPVVATSRNDCDRLRNQLLEHFGTSSDAERRLRVLRVDITDELTIKEMADQIRDSYPNTPLRLALTLPGILHAEKSPQQIDGNAALESFRVNTIGHLLLMKYLTALLPSKSSPSFNKTHSSVSPDDSPTLPSHAIYAMMAARVGSTSDNTTGGWYSYRSSKAAVFQLAKSLDIHLRLKSGDRALAVALHPGTVRTDFTKDYWGTRSMLEPEDAAKRLMRILTRIPSGIDEGRGRCWDWKGQEVLP